MARAGDCCDRGDYGRGKKRQRGSTRVAIAGEQRGPTRAAREEDSTVGCGRGPCGWERWVRMVQAAREGTESKAAGWPMMRRRQQRVAMVRTATVDRRRQQAPRRLGRLSLQRPAIVVGKHRGGSGRKECEEGAAGATAEEGRLAPPYCERAMKKICDILPRVLREGAQEL
ncbi:hypothetical protein BHE74_00048735 [Ensete ventricosum]|nr:hypothetical protein BHE74_00048735 [Ensete ventricosum]